MPIFPDASSGVYDVIKPGNHASLCCVAGKLFEGEIH